MTTTNNTRSIHTLSAGKSFKIVDEAWLNRFPSSRNVVYTVSVIKSSGGRTMVQSNSSRGCSTLKISQTKNVLVEIVANETEVLTLAAMAKYYTSYQAIGKQKPLQVKLNLNGEVGIYRIDQYSFWEQNHNNIRLTGLVQFGTRYKIPGAAIVMEQYFDLERH